MAKYTVEITETYMYVLEIEAENKDEVSNMIYETNRIINRDRNEIDELGSINTMFDYEIMGGNDND